VWGGSDSCEHEWGEEQIAREEAGWQRWKPNDGRKHNTVAIRTNADSKPSQGAFCRYCHAWRGSLGLEPTPELYIAHMAEVFREVKRVLRSDGTCWVNMGDSYAGSGPSGASYQSKTTIARAGKKQDGAFRISKRLGERGLTYANKKPIAPPGLKPKDLCGMPWRLAFALQADGWWLRSEIIWHKPNPMPESVRDRPTKAHETVFLLTKAARYYYDADAVRESYKPESAERYRYALQDTCNTYGQHKPGFKAREKTTKTRPPNPAGRNRRTVWTIPTAAFPGSHFATFPPALIEPMILTSPTKCCAVCGAGWERVTEKRETDEKHRLGAGWATHDGGHGSIHREGREQEVTYQPVIATTTLGFRPACDCLFPAWVPTPRQGKDETDAAYALRIFPVLVEQCQLMAIYESAEPEDTVPAVVLDPFVGSGTTIMVALRHGRNAIGLELSEEYAEMARRRIVADSPLFNHTGG